MAKADMTILVRVPLVEDRDRAILACERLTKERDQARGIAGELFRAYRELFNPKVRQYFEAYRLGDWSEVTEAYRRIRPEVRRRLEWK